ncbi:hypothetical protein AUF78_06715 [archaeon 13_1_20CM_2_51_12]|nr:MAG: hypothetical protein AUF78_06715 [archaeon 13_1_20CM_2_51_12]
MNPRSIGNWLDPIEVPFLKPMYKTVTAVIVLAMGAIVFNEKPRNGFVHPKSRDQPTLMDANTDLT